MFDRAGDAESLTPISRPIPLRPMDRLRRGYYRLAARNDFLRHKRQEFQAWFGQIMEMAHPGDYEPIRLTQGDGGLDGLLVSEAAVFAVFAPRECTESQLVAKMDGDFGSARSTMSDRDAVLRKIVFVHNDEGLTKVTGPELVRLGQANPDVAFERWTFEAIWLKIGSLSEDQLEELYGPGPSEENVDRLRFEAIRTVIDRLKKADPPAVTEITLPAAGKLEHNALSADYADLLRAGRRRQGLVGDFVQELTDPSTGEEIAEGFRLAYRELRDAGATPDETFAALWRHAGGEHFVGPTEFPAVASVVAYFFDSCDIFENAPDAP